MDLKFSTPCSSPRSPRSPGSPDISKDEDIDHLQDEISTLKKGVPGMDGLAGLAGLDGLDGSLMSKFSSLMKEDHLLDNDRAQTPRSIDLESTVSLGGTVRPWSKRRFDVLVYDDDEEDPRAAKDDSWSNRKKHRLHRSLWKLKYNRIVSSFYLDSLKRREEWWSWMIIVISTVTSGFTVANNVEKAPFETYNIIINSVLTTSSMMTSLIAGWIKKQGFVDKINEIDKYLIDLNRLCEELEIQFSLIEDDRMPYSEFKHKYVPEITKFVSTNPSIPPNEWKDAVREITLKYPELVDPDNSETNKLWPWFGDLVKYTDEHGQTHNIRRPTTFMKYMKKTNKDRILSSCCRKKRDCDNVY